MDVVARIFLAVIGVMIVWIGWWVAIGEMHPVTGIAFAAMGVTIALMIVLPNCECGRSRRWYYFDAHPKAWLFLTMALLGTALCIIHIIIEPDVTSALIWAVLSVHYWRRWWFHEKDKWKRRLEKTASRVTVDRHGRLRISPAPVR